MRIGNAQEAEVLSASEHAESLKKALCSVEQYKKFLNTKQREVTLTRILTGSTYTALSFLSIMSILSPYKAGDIDTTKKNTLLAIACIVVLLIVKKKSNESDKEAESKIKSIQQDIKSIMDVMFKTVDNYNDCVDKLSNGKYSYPNLSKINLDDLAKELKLDNIIVDLKEAEARRVSNEPEENREASRPALSTRRPS